MMWQYPYQEAETLPDRLAWLRNRPRRSRAVAAPATDLAETAQAYEISVTLPGVKPEDLDVTVRDNLVAVRGTQREEPGDPNRHYLVREHRPGTLSRTIVLPERVDADRVEAWCEYGILNIRAPKAGQAGARRVTVRGEGSQAR